MRIMTKQEAIDSGMTASQIRTVARSLQRIARHGYGTERSYSHPRNIHQNIRELFKLARKM